MDKLNTGELNEALKDVRKAYRLIALYQKRVLDIVKYCSNNYNVVFNSGWAKFSIPAQNGNRANINYLSWNWLSLYTYEFNLGRIDRGEDRYHFKIVHQADTGYYDANAEKKVGKINVDQFGDVNTSKTRLFFVLSKNDNGCPMQHVLNGNLTTHDNQQILKGNWLAVPFDLQRFASQETTDMVLQEFNGICRDAFGVEINSEKQKLD
ncbi:hypothetical protein [Brumimicrobium aurantiacum]|uniref:Uncharacterized protein n=1 Tax=Brumimicrobium aurantiacum TaxID=1737063 RepID=A0A3E1EZL3_9FLAO|nr:hypothetical protein [Brumimicrobium aurantiacum]RFC55012.1 hypothetical protein DXU93_04100 [Brumimicrobium aurantiacum]